jgi:hypothetical protein
LERAWFRPLVDRVIFEAISAMAVMGGLSAFFVVVFEVLLRAFSSPPTGDQHKAARESEWHTDITSELQQANERRLDAISANAAMLGASLEEQLLQWQQESALEFPLLRLSLSTARAAVLTAFRKAAHFMHPDKGGDATRFRELLAERDRALATT